MSHFLDHLVSRALATEPAVQPRLPSMFEPPQLAASDPVVEQHRELAPELQDRSQQMRRHNKPVAVEYSDELLASERWAISPEPPRSNTPSGTDASRSESSVQPDLMLPNSPAPASPAIGPEHSAIPALHHITGESAAPDRSHNFNSPQPPRSTSAPDGNQPDSVINPTADRPSKPPVSTASQPKPEHETPTRPRTGTLLRPSTRPQMPGSTVANKDRSIVASTPPAGRSSHGTEPPAPPATPSVIVSIGRVEIRAVSKPVTPPRNEPSPAPRLSLDEYLKRHNGGRR